MTIKRFFLAALLLLAINTHAFSQVDISGEWRMRTEYEDNYDYDSVTRSYIRQRVRLQAGTDINEFTKALIRLQWGDDTRRYWGDNSETSDNEWQFRLSQAYIKLYDPDTLPVELTLGRQSFKLGDKLVISDDGDGIDGINMTYRFSESSFTGIWFKVNEGDRDIAAEDDEDWYGLAGSFKVSDSMTFEPYYLTDYAGNAVSIDTTTGHDQLNYYGLRITGSAGDLSYKAEYAFQDGQFGSGSGAIDKEASAMIGGVFYKLPCIKAGVEYFYGTGDDSDTAGKDEDFESSLADPDITRIHEYNVTNLNALQFSISGIKVTEKLTLKLIYAMLKNNEGIEERGDSLDIDFSYPLGDNLKACGYAAFFMPGDSISAVSAGDETRIKYRFELKALF